MHRARKARGHAGARAQLVCTARRATAAAAPRRWGVGPLFSIRSWHALDSTLAARLAFLGAKGHPPAACPFEPPLAKISPDKRAGTAHMVLPWQVGRHAGPCTDGLSDGWFLAQFDHVSTGQLLVAQRLWGLSALRAGLGFFWRAWSCWPLASWARPARPNPGAFVGAK